MSELTLTQEQNLVDKQNEQLIIINDIVRHCELFKNQISDVLNNFVKPNVSNEKLTQNIDWEKGVFQNLDLMYAKALESQIIFDDLIDFVAQKTWWIQTLKSCKVWLKSLDWVVDKIYSQYDWYEVEKLTDLLRGSIVFDDIDNLNSSVEEILKNKSVKKAYVRNRMDNLLTNDIFLNIELENWFVWELQLHVKETLQAKEKWYILPKEYINLENFWLKEEHDFVNNLAKSKKTWRNIEEWSFLPWNEHMISWHNLYKIRRSLWNTEFEKNLVFKLKILEETLNIYARELYEQRLFKKFSI